MARRKQARPSRNGRVTAEEDEDEALQAHAPDGNCPISDGVEEVQAPPRKKRVRRDAPSEPETKEVLWRSMILPELSGKEVAEINLLNIRATTQLETKDVLEDLPFRVRIEWRNEDSRCGGNFKEIPISDLKIQIVAYSEAKYLDGGNNGFTAAPNQSEEIAFNTERDEVLSGEVDGSNATLSALVYLIEHEYITLRPASCLTSGALPSSTHTLPSRMRIVISEKAFTNAGKYVRKKRKALQTIMCWLRPEIHSLSGIRKLSEEAIAESHGRGIDMKKQTFDPTALYEAVKPSRTEQTEEMSFSQLVPKLRPYQREAALWMVQREKGYGEMVCSSPDEFEDTTDAYASSSASTSAIGKWNPDMHPLWLAVKPIDGASDFYYNSFSGVLSTEPGDFVSYVRGGILADEMGLGKTVELLACILSNPNKDLPTPTPSERARKDLQDTLLKRKVRRLECVCGSAEEEEYEDSCVKCVICDAWQHSTCVAHKKPTEQSAGQWNEESSKTESKSKGTGAQSRCTKMRSKLRENNNDILSTGNKFVCGTCAELIARVEVEDSGATLIVCPTPILQQWQEEILRHTNPSSLRVIVYEGVGKGAKIIRSTTKGCPFLKIVSAHDLAAADIVLTTYDTLRSDLSHDADETQSVKRSLRYLKRFPVIPTPLTRLKWWRVCLDEAQMVESTTTRATEMALLLKAQNRWCVSGTPIQRGLDDIFGLLKFLQAKPFHEYQHWSQVLQQPYEAGDPWAIQFLHRFLRMFMWRLSKTDVEDELNLPKQKEDVTWLQFTPLELFYYQEQLKNCAVKSKDVISKYRKQKATSLDNADTPLPQSEAVILSRALLQLRQACCHPQVGSLKQSKPMTMDETLQDLLEEQRQTAEVHQRQLIGAWNGLAALSIIENDMSKAKSLYREALTLIDKNEAEVHVDPLQKLHILHNLAEIVNAPGSNETRTLRDDLLTKQCEEIRSKYSGSFVTKLQIEKEKYEQAQHQVFEANKACEESGGTDWWLEVLSLAEQRSDGGRELVGKIKCHFLESGNSKRGRLENASSLTHRFRDISGLKFVLQGELLAIQEKREKVTKQLKALDNMMKNLTAEYAERHANCKIHSEEKGDPCDHCLIENVFQEYENRLLLLRTLSGKADGIILAEEAIFAQNKIAAQRRIFRPNVDSTIEYNAAGRSTRDSNAIQSQVIWAPSETEEILSLIKTYAKFSGLRQRDASKKHLQMFETLRKEYGQMRKWVTSQRDFLHAFDELNMATIRLNLQVLGEKPETALEKMVKVSIEEVPFRKMELEMERDEAKKGLSNAEGAIRFLKGQSSRRRQGDPHVVNVGCASQEVANVIELDREEEEFCQICWQKFHSQEGVLSSKQKSVGHRMILLCGHLMCENCCIQLIGRTPLPANGKDEKCIPCPQCRQRTDLSKIKRVMDDSDRNNLAVQGGHFTDSSRDTEESQITVKGDYGTKITAIVRRMKLVTSKDPQVKVLIFSTWQDVLEVIGHALKENGIRSARVKGSNLQKALQEFRGLPEAKILNSRRQSSNLTLDGPIQAFLLPFNVGGNGLNLVEAQHVILVEPLPNPGVEAQAINRVHRIGQSRPTFVHRFIVSESVEQSLYEMGRKQTDISKLPPSRNWNRNPFEYTDITSVFDLFSGALADVEEGASSGGPHSLDNTRNISPTEAAGAAAEARRNANLALEVPRI